MAHACPVHGAPVSPGTGNKGNNPLPDIPNPAVGSATGTLSIKLQHAAVRRGTMEQATIQAGNSGAISLSVSYAGRVGMKRSLHAGAARSLAVRWRVPRAAHSGRAVVRVVSAATGASLQAVFTVR
jgi:hypothetical protein